MPSNETHRESLSLLKSIDGLKNLELPDQWYEAKDELPGRWRSTALFMKTENKMEESLDDLTAGLIGKYDNHGKPFVHLVCYNMPFLCPKCGFSEGFCRTTVVSVKEEAFVNLIDPQTIHDIRKHGGSFTGEQLKRLGKIFGR